MIETVDIVRQIIRDKEGWENSEKYLDNAKWLKENISTLGRGHEGEIIIVRDQEIIFSSDNPTAVRRELQALDIEERNQSYVCYIPKEKEITLW